MEKRDGFIPKEDIEFEKELRRQELEEEAERERLTQEKKETEERERAEYEKNLQDRKIELMKLKQGVIESSDVIKEVHEEKAENFRRMVPLEMAYFVRRGDDNYCGLYNI